MTKIIYKNKCLELNPNESVLECLLRKGYVVAHSCKAGVCQSCLMKASSGQVPLQAQKGMKATFKQQGLFLACQCYPLEDLTVRDIVDDEFLIGATIRHMEYLNDSVVKVNIVTDSPFSCEPGQYVSLINPDHIIRSYSIANNPDLEGCLEFHIRLIEHGRMSGWLKNEAVNGSRVQVRGPAGNCFYTEQDHRDFSIMLIGTGTGLAPLYGILNEALRLHHQGPISLFHGALQAKDLYLVDRLRETEKVFKNFSYYPCVLQNDDGSFLSGDIQKIALKKLPDNKKETHVFLCGAPDMVNSLKTQIFLEGVPSQNIYADPFLRSSQSR